MRKIVINKQFGGFGLSTEAESRYRTYSADDGTFIYDIPRDDEHLVRVVEELGNEANSGYSKLRVVEIPEDVSWHIHESDGMESIHEDHRSWS